MLATESQQPEAEFTNGKMARHVARLSGFMIVGFLTMTGSLFVEAIYLGMVSTEAIAAVTFTFPVTMALGAATRGLGMGAGAVLARAMGSGDRQRATFLTTHGLLLVLVFNIACSASIYAFAHPLFHLLGARGEVLDLVVAYIEIAALAFPLFGMTMVGTGLMRSIGDPVYPGMVMAFGSLLQIAIGPFLIFGLAGFPALGVEGAAWSFAIARSLSFLVSAHWFVVRERMIRLSLRNFGDSCRAILHVGIPAMLSNLIEPLAAAVITRLIAGFGTVVIAGFGVATRIEAVVFMVVIGISSSAAPLVGQNWGARRFDRVDLALKLCYRYCLVWGLIAATLMWLGGRWLAAVVDDAPEVVAVAALYLAIIPITIGFSGMVNVAAGAFNALSKPAPPLILSVVRLGALYVPLTVAGAQLFGLVGIFVAVAATNVVTGLWAYTWNRRTIARERLRA